MITIVVVIIHHSYEKMKKVYLKSPYYKQKKSLSSLICTPFTGQTSKGGIYYALLIRIQNEMCRIISERNMGRNS